MIKREFLLSMLICIVIGIPLYWLEKTYTIRFGADWEDVYYPATSLLLHGSSPYQITRLHNPVWALFPLIPFAILGKELGKTALFFVNLLSFAFVALRLKARVPELFMFLLSPLVLYALYFGNIDWLVLWGFLLPAPVALFFLVIKPQIGIGLALYLVYVSWRDGGLRELAITILPTLLLLVATFFVFGNWIVDRTDHLLTGGASWNVSTFQWSVPIGLFLLIAAIRGRKALLAIAASPFMSPYLALGSWSIAMLGIIRNKRLVFGAFVGTWVLIIMNAVLILRK